MTPHPATSSDLRGEAHDEAVHPVLGVFPLGFLLGGLLALTHAFLAHRARGDTSLSDEAVDFRLFAQAVHWPLVLGEAILAGVVCALVLAYAFPAKSLWARCFAVVVASVAIGAFVTGFPADVPGAGAAPLCASAGLLLIAIGLARIPFAGVVPLVVGVLIGIALPIGAAYRVQSTEPGMLARDVLVDLVASPDLLTTVARRPDAEPHPGVITPVVDQQSDTGDKPSLILPPNASQEFVVPNYGDGARLFAAAAADLSVAQHFPDGIDVAYRVLVDGETRWSTRIAHRPMPPGRWDTSGMRWRHVEEDGERGIAVRAGEVVRFETELIGGASPGDVNGDHLKLGFGGVMLTRTGRLPRAVATPDAPNIVFIVMDTLRKDRVGAYGYERPTTPNIDRLAAQGVRFSEAYATSSWTWPSTASLLTGLPPDAHGVKSAESCTLNQRIETLAEALQKRGYTTAAFVGNPIVEPNRYFDQGFESFDVEVPVFRPSDEVVPPALEWLREHAPLRFFLYLHLVDPHTPHVPHPEEALRLGLGPKPPDWPEGGLDRVSYDELPSDDVRAYTHDLYDASVATGDRWVGKVLAELDALELTDSTVICFTTDHGEELYDHGSHGHGHALWAELVESPLIFKGPEIPRDVRHGAVSNRYVPTTLARIAGADLSVYGANVDLLLDPTPGIAHFETAKGRWGEARRQQLFGVRRGPYTTHWRAMEMAASAVAAPNMRRFDVLSDPGEDADVIEVRVSEGREDVAVIQEFVKEAKEERPPLVLGMGEDGRNTFEQIGYGGKNAPD